MPSKDEHVTWAKRNEAHARACQDKGRAGKAWAAVSLFYAGLHWARAWLSTKGYTQNDYDSHRKMEKLLAASGFRRLAEYKELYDASIAIRYECPDDKEISLLSKVVESAYQSLSAYVKGDLRP